MTTVHRRGRQKRELRRAFGGAACAAAVGPITRGCEIFGIATGSWSLIDLICHCLSYTGPADAVISTWTAAGADLTFAHKLLVDGNLRSLRFLVDFSFPSRQPAYCAALRERFGDDGVRVCKNHAKFCLLMNEGWHLVIRSSMNLNLNSRLETFEVSDDAAMAAFLGSVVEELFRAESGAANLAKRPGEHCKEFAARYPAGPGAGVSTDEKKYFSDEPFGNDLRRVGLTYSRG